MQDLFFFYFLLSLQIFASLCRQKQKTALSNFISARKSAILFLISFPTSGWQDNISIAESLFKQGKYLIVAKF